MSNNNYNNDKNNEKNKKNNNNNNAGSTPVSSTSFDKMQQDKRYAPANEVPEEVISTMGSDEVFSPGFSIKGQALKGRASYLVSAFPTHEEEVKVEKEIHVLLQSFTTLCVMQIQVNHMRRSLLFFFLDQVVSIPGEAMEERMGVFLSLSVRQLEKTTTYHGRIFGGKILTKLVANATRFLHART